jgi:hypothetical protein
MNADGRGFRLATEGTELTEEIPNNQILFQKFVLKNGVFGAKNEPFSGRGRKI